MIGGGGGELEHPTITAAIATTNDTQKERSRDISSPPVFLGMGITTHSPAPPAVDSQLECTENSWPYHRITPAETYDLDGVN